VRWGKFIASGGQSQPGGELPVNNPRRGFCPIVTRANRAGSSCQSKPSGSSAVEAGARQVGGAGTAFVQGHGGHASISASTVLIAD